MNKLQQPAAAVPSPVQATATPPSSSSSVAAVKGPVVSVDTKEPDVKQPVAKATTVTPTKKVTEKVPPPVKVDCVCACVCVYVCVSVCTCVCACVCVRYGR